MKKYLTVLAAFVVMLCIGSVYAWSIVAAELMANYGFSGAQSQTVFGTLIAVFPVTMIFVGRLAVRWQPRFLGVVSGILFFGGYFLAGVSGGSFWLTWLGVGVLGGVATGFGYWVALTIPVQWFPEKKGLITGIAAAGFGLGAVFMSEWAAMVLSSGRTVLQLLSLVGGVYGLLIILLSLFIKPHAKIVRGDQLPVRQFLRSGYFLRFFVGIFLGTFAGLLIIGSLKLIGEEGGISSATLVHSVALFAVANFFGRLTWGALSDHWSASLNVFMALLLQGLAIAALNVVGLTDGIYLLLSGLIGFGFGSNFVLFAKASATVFGVQNLGLVYPYVFLGYAIAGIAGPFSGGYLFDLSGNFSTAIYLAALMSLAGSLLFLISYIRKKRRFQ